MLYVREDKAGGAGAAEVTVKLWDPPVEGWCVVSFGKRTLHAGCRRPLIAAACRSDQQHWQQHSLHTDDAVVPLGRASQHKSIFARPSLQKDRRQSGVCSQLSALGSLLRH